jgi:SecD/SecF fusion protein
MRYKWWFLGTISAVTVFAFVAVFVVGLNFGIDFKGGGRMQVGLNRPASVDVVRSAAVKAGVKDPVVQSLGSSSGSSQFKSFLITAHSMSQAQADQLKQSLGQTSGVDAKTTSFSLVGGSFSRQTTDRALIAIAIAIVAIIGYLSLRFEFKFAIPAIVALIHDVGLTLGIYAVTNRVVTTATVAAILTILGYSVHDTIIVFDRIRENTHFMKRETYSDMVDRSISQTMIRSINTTICLLLPLLAILFFGGLTLKDFAFALTIGTLTGTYSSFFVASPLVVLWKEREPRYHKRVVAAAAAAAGGGQVEVAMSTAPAKAAAVSGSRAQSAPEEDSGATPRPAKPRVSQKPKKGKTSKRPVSKTGKRPSR